MIKVVDGKVLWLKQIDPDCSMISWRWSEDRGVGVQRSKRLHYNGQCVCLCVKGGVVVMLMRNYDFLLKSTAEKLRGTVGVPCPELWLELPVSVLPL